MSSTPMTPAQAAQQNNRHADGTYATKTHAEQDGFEAPGAGQGRSNDLDGVIARGWREEHFAASPNEQAKADRASAVVAGLGPGYQFDAAHSGDLTPAPYGYLSTPAGIRKVPLEEMGDWSAEGWEQAQSIVSVAKAPVSEEQVMQAAQTLRHANAVYRADTADDVRYCMNEYLDKMGVEVDETEIEAASKALFEENRDWWQEALDEKMWKLREDTIDEWFEGREDGKN